MQVKKVFSVDTIKINQKPSYVKPKYKTYRELLDLDRPKKIIQHQSDDENDDFLEKLMKKQKKKQQEEKQKEKEKKQSAKSKQLSQAQQSQPSNNEPTAHLQIQKKKTSKENSSLPSAKSKQNEHNESVEYLEKKIETQEMGSILNSNKKKNTTQNEQLQFSEINQSSNHNKKQPVRVSIRKRNSSEENLRKNHKLHSDKKTDSITNTQEQLFENIIIQSQTEANKIIKHKFLTSHKLRKVDGLRELQRNTHQEKPSAKMADHLIQTKLNPQKKVIQHKINPQKYVKQNQISYSQRAKDYLLKSASSPPVQMILMSKSPRNVNQSKYKNAMIARKSLFKSTYQEQLFIKSLKKQ